MLSRPPETSSHTVLSAARLARLWSTKASLAVLPMALTVPVGLLDALDHAEQRGLAGAVGADDADDGAGRHL